MLSVELRVIEGNIKLKESIPKAINTIKRIQNDPEDKGKRHPPYQRKSGTGKRKLEQLHADVVGDGEHLKVEIDEETSSISVKLIDSYTNRLIREISEEKASEIIGQLQEVAGLIMDEYA